VPNVRIVTPISSLGGRRFEPQAERELHELAETVAPTLPGANGGVMLIPEMPSPLGLPDFIALTGGETWLEARATSGVPPILGEADCAVLAAMTAGRSLSAPSVAKRVGWSLSQLESVLLRLERQNAVQRSRGGAYRLNSSLVPQGSVFALEAKVKDWSRAVLQGRAYRTWANNYVVLLGEVGPVAERRAAEGVAKDGAGLYSATGWLVRPRSRRPPLANRLRGFEYVFAATGVSSPSF